MPDVLGVLTAAFLLRDAFSVLQQHAIVAAAHLGVIKRTRQVRLGILTGRLAGRTRELVMSVRWTVHRTSGHTSPVGVWSASGFVAFLDEALQSLAFG